MRVRVIASAALFLLVLMPAAQARSLIEYEGRGEGARGTSLRFTVEKRESGRRFITRIRFNHIEVTCDDDPPFTIGMGRPNENIRLRDDRPFRFDSINKLTDLHMEGQIGWRAGAGVISLAYEDTCTSGDVAWRVHRVGLVGSTEGH